MHHHAGIDGAWIEPASGGNQLKNLHARKQSSSLDKQKCFRR